jgi:hypothetical protein
VRVYPGPTELWCPDRPRFLYVFTKDSMFRWWFRVFAENAPQDIGLIAHGSTPSPATAKLIAGVARSLGVPLVLLGDLDPGDLTASMALVSARPGSLLYGGVDDELLQLARRYLGVRRFERECLVPMSPLEREQLALLTPLCPPLTSLYGPASVRLLASGRKCELEAILGSHVSQGPYLAAVRRHLTARLPARLGL